MQAALEKFKKDRPEEFQEYQGYRNDRRNIRLKQVSLIVAALTTVILICLWVGILFGIGIALLLTALLVWRIKKLSEKLHIIELSMALMEMTFDDNSEISPGIQEELRDLFKDKD
jgi:uncharacterized membrane protein